MLGLDPALEASADLTNPFAGPTLNQQLQLLPLLIPLFTHNPNSFAPSAQLHERYHWKGLLWQSFAFFGVENSFRLMTDPYFRYLTADKPYWHDYIASFEQWNMRRWSDGDDFLVAYIGHSMQGSITEFIEIQNDPRGRMLEIGRDPAYWHSLFKSVLWATAYSTDQKIGPLGETALGSEGGYTYVIGCPAYCYSYNPATDKVTNNTGWVKFITTPVVGTLWTLTEDFLDRYVSDPVQAAHPGRVFPEILRGSLNPSRTMANLLRGKSPWYRDFQHPEYPLSAGVHHLRDSDSDSGPDDPVPHLPRYQFFPHLNAQSLPVGASSDCAPCRRLTNGPGIGFTWLFGRWWDLESDLDYQPKASPIPSDRAGGNITIATFGLGIGLHTPNYSLRASVRPGFLSYNRAYLTAPTVALPVPPTGRITHFTTALAITGDHTLNRHLALRLSLANTAVRYDTYRLDRVPGVGQEPYLDWISPKVYATNENWTLQIGPVLRF